MGVLSCVCSFTGSVKSMKNVLLRKLLSNVKRQRRDDMPKANRCMRNSWRSSHRRRRRKRGRGTATTRR